MSQQTAQSHAETVEEARRLLAGITPGEWTVGSERQIDDNCVDSNRTMDQDGDWQDGKSSVAFTCYDSPYYAADMQLIAAAPRLIRTLLEALTAPDDATGQGRLLLNDYGRRCWDAGYRTVHAEIREEEHEKQRLSTLLSELRSLRDDMQAQAVTHRQRVTIAEAARKHAHADHDAALDCDDWAATLSRLTGDTT